MRSHALSPSLFAALFFVDCSTPNSQPQGPEERATANEPIASVSATASDSEGSELKAAVGPAGEITNSPPDGGVVMDNATPPGDGGPSTRLQPIIDVIATNREKFRSCFDVWGSKNPGRELQVTLSIKLEPDGKLVSAQFKPDETEIVDQPMESCMADAAKSLKFPASPNDQLTRYNHRFVFKAKKN